MRTALRRVLAGVGAYVLAYGLTAALTVTRLRSLLGQGDAVNWPAF